MRRFLLALIVALAPASLAPAAFAPAAAEVPNIIVLDAQSAARKGNYEEAIRLYTEALATGELKPFMQVAALNGRGLVYYRQQVYPQAMNDFTAALNIEPGNATVLRNRCFVFIEMREWGYAIDDCRASAGALEPDDPQGPDTIGYVYLRQARNYEAIDFFNQSIAMDANYGPAYLHRGMAYYNIGDRVRGRDDLLMAQSLMPNNVEVENQLRRMGLVP